MDFWHHNMNANALRLAWLGPPISSLPPQYFYVPRITFVWRPQVRFPDPPVSQYQGPTSTLYSNRARIFLSYSNSTRKFLRNDRVASSVYYSHFRKIAGRPASQYYSLMDTALVEILSFISSLCSATNLVFYIIFNFRNKQNWHLFSTY